jgi:NAD(P)-dependent dehydrogenase (short-subunit alcohol dehydrogenase family)
MRLEGRVVAVAGAGGALGPTLVRRLVEEGATLALAGRHLAKLEALAVDAELEAVDMLDEPAVRAWADRLARDHGRVDALAHIVGGWRGGTPIEDAPPDEWDDMHRQLVLSLQTATRAFTPHLLASGRGRLAIVSSPQAQAPTNTNAAYAAAKAAAEAWTLALAHRFRATGATANIVVVGGSIVPPEAREAEPDRDFGLFTPAEEVADAIVYLFSDEAASMNGQRLALRGAR